jgi:branched-chain amino acid transport system permease protein
MEATARAGRDRLATTAWKAARGRLDLVLLGLAIIAIPFLPGASLGVAGLGGINRATLALQGMGMLLVLRSSRVINFAQVQLGVLSGAMFVEMVRHSELIVLGNTACGGCIGGLRNDFLYLQSHPAQVTAQLLRGHTVMVAVNFWVSALLALAVGTALSWLVYRVVVRRFETASVLMGTVVTIGLAPLLIALAAWLPSLFQSPQHEAVFLPSPSVLPHVDATVTGVAFHFTDVLTLAAVVVAGGAVAMFLRFHAAGRAMRTVADNRARALTLGVRVSHVSSLSWILAGALSSIATVFVAMGGNLALNRDTSAFDVGGLVVVLLAVVFARFSSLALVVIGCITLGAMQSVFFRGFAGDLPYDLTILGVMAAGLLLQAPPTTRAAREVGAFVQRLAREVRPIPPELRHVPSVERAVALGRVLAVLAVAGLPWFLAPDQVSAMSVIVVDAIVGFSLLILTGWAGQISLGQLAFAGIGGYLTAILAGNGGVFMPLAVLAGGVAGSLVAIAAGLPALRLRGLYLAVITLALNFATFVALVNPAYLGRFLPTGLARPSILGLSFDDERWFFYLSLAFLVAAYLALRGLRNSRVGRILIACRDNEEAGQSFGVSLVRVRLQAFAVSGFLAAVAGGLLVYDQHGLQASSFAPELSLVAFALVILGGLGSVAGPLLGAVFGGVLFLVNNPIVNLLGTGLGVIVILIVYPEGLAGMAFAARDAWLRRVAMRLRIAVPSLFDDSSVDPLDAAAPIAPKLRPTGGAAFVPRRYELAGQWSAFEGLPGD